MHLPGAHHRRPLHLLDHTPRPHEVHDSGTDLLSPAMFGPTGMVGPTLVPLADQTKSDVPANTISTSDSSINPSSPTSSQKSQDESCPPSFELSARTCSPDPILDNMMTQTNLLVLPPSNPSYHMAYFLKTTGPAEERPKAVKHKRISSAMRLFKSSNRRPSESLTAAHQRLNDVIIEEAEPGVARASSPEARLPDSVVQKVSKTGKKYLQIEAGNIPHTIDSKLAPSLSPDILESRVSVFFDEQTDSENVDNWFIVPGSCANEDEAPARGRTMSTKLTATECSVRIMDIHDDTLIRRKASAPVLLAADSGVDIAIADTGILHDKIAPLRSHPVSTETLARYLPLVPEQKAASDLPAPINAPKMAHPSPRHVGSHSILLQRTVSDATSVRYPRDSTLESGRSVSDPHSPGHPQHRSPLRAVPHDQQIRNPSTNTRAHAPVVATSSKPDVDWSDGRLGSHGESTITALPQFNTRNAPSANLEPLSTSSGASIASNDIFNAPRGRSKHPKQDLSSTVRGSATKPAQPDLARRRLRRARAEGSRSRGVAKAQPQTAVRQVATGSFAEQSTPRRALPRVDVVENIRIVPKSPQSPPKFGDARRPINTILRVRNSPAPRPRSAKVTRSQARSIHIGSRPSSPVKSFEPPETPTLPSPPPKRELPPRPTVAVDRTSYTSSSGVPINAALARARSTKTLPSTPIYDRGRSFDFPSPPSSAQQSPAKRNLSVRHNELPSAAAREAAYPAPMKEENVSSRLEERLAAVERRNKLLEAALMAVLKTSGTLNGCPCGLDSPASSTPPAHRHKAQYSFESGKSSESAERDVLDLFKETKVRY